MEVNRRRGRRRKKLLDDLKDRRGYSYLKEEALDSTMWRNRFGEGFGSVVKQNIELMNEFGKEFNSWTCYLGKIVGGYYLLTYSMEQSPS